MNTTTKYSLSAVILLGFVFIIYTLQISKNETQENIVSTAETKVSVTNAPVDVKSVTTYVPTDFMWKSEADPQKGDIPKEKISIEVKGKVYALGEYSNCFLKKPFEQLESGQISKVKCWYGGAGNEIAVYNENGSYSIKKRWTQESGGPEVGAQPYGPWEVVTKLP
jgi:hypothetical protein